MMGEYRIRECDWCKLKMHSEGEELGWKSFGRLELRIIRVDRAGAGFRLRGELNVDGSFVCADCEYAVGTAMESVRDTRKRVGQERFA